MTHRRTPNKRAVFGNFLEKNSYFSAIIGITFRMFLEPFERNKFLRFESQWKKLNSSVLSLVTGQVQNTLKFLHFWV